ncbi:hypothetical protein FBZ89_105163 [Nitrospirillum amazonense]|uniref:BrnT family toxin n=1 Tax=Nitrospirillum amazonense TaxID=28077 RepID=A0A560FI50_9PROT|nr:BrnT family toxin [Nitrospirillum amazonense]TWB21291.1 hypothetical protein FBZ89_105163 [Nitrospirillum amazonense]
MRWTWDPRKAEANLRKHKVGFDLAALALDDPYALTMEDPYPDEERWDTVCSVVKGAADLILFVVHTLPDAEEGAAPMRRKGRPDHQRPEGDGEGKG